MLHAMVLSQEVTPVSLRCMTFFLLWNIIEDILKNSGHRTVSVPTSYKLLLYEPKTQWKSKATEFLFLSDYSFTIKSYYNLLLTAIQEKIKRSNKLCTQQRVLQRCFIPSLSDGDGGKFCS